VADVDAVVITHMHPDHCVDLYGLHVLNRYGLERFGLPVYAPAGVEAAMTGLVGDWGGAFDWRAVGEGGTAQVGPIALCSRRPELDSDHLRHSLYRSHSRVLDVSGHTYTAAVRIDCEGSRIDRTCLGPRTR